MVPVGEGVAEGAAVPLLSWSREEPARGTPEGRLWRECRQLQRELRQYYMLPDPPFREKAIPAPGALNLFPTALPVSRFPDSSHLRHSFRLRQLLRC